MSLKLDKNGWSVKELRAIIDQGLKPPTPVATRLASESGVDPMASVWANLDSNLKDLVGVSQVSEMEWQFSVKFANGSQALLAALLDCHLKS